MLGTDPGTGAQGAAVALLDEHDLPAGPLDFARTLGLAGPLDIDVGFGKGRSLVEWAAHGFGGGLLGVEVRRSFAQFAAGRLARVGAVGVRIVRGDFRALAVRLGPSGAVRRFFFHFPDPWWKKKHLKRQVVSAPVLAEVVRLLAPGGEVFVQTDVPERAAEFRAAFAAAGLEEVHVSDGVGGENPLGVRSNREIRCAEAGLPVWRMVVRKGRNR
jgi:tRNA (guanine-N7-)-methyltransferase